MTFLANKLIIFLFLLLTFHMCSGLNVLIINIKNDLFLDTIDYSIDYYRELAD